MIKKIFQNQFQKRFNIDNSSVCAESTDEGKDTCTGGMFCISFSKVFTKEFFFHFPWQINSDGGGPLVCSLLHNPDRYVQIGITSAAIIECKTGTYPGVYTSVIEELCFVKWATYCQVMQGNWILGH